MNYSDMQRIAKETIAYIKGEIRPGMGLRDIRSMCEEKMLSLGADSFWYYDIGAFVFSGDETALSVSGREYVTSDRKIASDDIITIDLSPSNKNIWGDCTRTVIVENGVVIDKINDIKNSGWMQGLLMEERLHEELLTFAKPETTFEELYFHFNQIINDNGFVNLDFKGNLGHSIVKNRDDRIYIEKGNGKRLSSVDYFTFEPHISLPGSPYGYKKENIYYFASGKLKEL